MRTINEVTLMGNVGKEPEIKNFTAFKVAEFSLATQEQWRDGTGELQSKTDWHRVKAFDKLADVVEKYVHTGSKLYIKGKINYSKSKEGAYFTDIKVNNLIMLDSPKTKISDDSPAEAKYYQKPASNPSPAPKTRMPAPKTSGIDDDVPF